MPHCKRARGARDHAATENEEKNEPEELQTADQQGIEQQNQPSSYEAKIKEFIQEYNEKGLKMFL